MSLTVSMKCRRNWRRQMRPSIPSNRSWLEQSYRIVIQLTVFITCDSFKLIWRRLLGPIDRVITVSGRPSRGGMYSPNFSLWNKTSSWDAFTQEPRRGKRGWRIWFARLGEQTGTDGLASLGSAYRAARIMWGIGYTLRGTTIVTNNSESWNNDDEPKVSVRSVNQIVPRNSKAC